jgi:hypothetical protein
MCHERVHLELWIDSDSEPISGCVIAQDSEEEDFAGWVELTAAIETARQHVSGATSRTAEGR